MTDDEFNKGPMDGYHFDGDRTKIVYAIDYLLYHNKINKLSLGNASDGMNFSGDTINTFRTLFGNRFTGTEEIVERNLNFDKKQIDAKNNFFRTYQRIGNFYILPNGKYSDTTINKYRGTYKEYKDFFDIFLRVLYTDKDKILTSLKQTESNSEFFNKYSRKEQFCELFFLQDYENLDYNHPSTKNGSRCNYQYFSSLGISSEVYKEFAFNYIKMASDLINKRSEKIVRKLKNDYKL